MEAPFIVLAFILAVFCGLALLIVGINEGT
jgi:hypothetical protein